MTLKSLDKLRSEGFAKELYRNFNILYGDNLLLRIADEIEREVDKYYLPRPLFEDGEPVHTGDETDHGTAWVIAVFGDGDWHVHTIDGTILKSEDYDSVLKRPSPKVLDADGVEIKVGDTVWDVRSGERFDVINVISKNCVHTVQGHAFVHPDETLTHKMPDTQERIDEDATLYAGYYCSKYGIKLKDGFDCEEAETKKVLDLLRRQRRLMGGDA